MNLIILAVYSKNRNFRIYLSTKWGKDSYLLLSPYCKMNLSEKEIFLASLICNTSMNTNILSCDNQLPKPTIITNKHVNISDQSGYTLSPYPHIDEFIK